MSARALLLPVVTLAVAGSAACARDSKPALFESAAAAGQLALADSEANAVSSTVRLVNALPGANGVEITSGELPLFSAVDYKSVTPYVTMTDNLSRFRLKSASRDTVVTTNSALLADGSRYTIVAMPGSDGATVLRVLLDDLAPEEGKSRVRLVHAVRGEADVTATLAPKGGSQGEPLLEGLGFGMESGYRDIEPAEGTLVVRNDRTGRELLRKPLRLVSGHAYTIVITGAPDTRGGAVRRVDALVIDDQAVTLGGTRDPVADSLRRARRARRDSLAADSAAQRDSADTTVRDTVRDTVRRDTIRRDTIRDSSDTNLVRSRR